MPAFKCARAIGNLEIFVCLRFNIFSPLPEIDSCLALSC